MPVTRALIRRAQVVALAVGLASIEARAQPPAPSPRSLSVEYSAPEGCPDRAAFVAAILARAPSAVVTTGDTAAISLRVAVGAEGRSTLWIALENGSSRRDIEGATCEDAVASMALIASMVVEAEPEQRIATADTAGSARSASGENAVTRAGSASPPTESSSVPPLVAPKVSSRAASHLARSRTSPARSAQPATRWGAAATLGIATESAVAGTPPLGLAAGAELGLRRATGWGIFARGELIGTLPAKERAAAGSAELYLLAGRLSACTPRELSARLQLAPCATFDAGRLYAGGSDVQGAESATMPWLALGLLLRANYDFASTWGIEAALGAKRLARHDRFYFRPNTTAYEVPAFSVGGTLGIHFHLF